MQFVETGEGGEVGVGGGGGLRVVVVVGEDGNFYAGDRGEVVICEDVRDCNADVIVG